MDCPKYDLVSEADLSCEECDHWKIVKILPESERYPVGFAVQRCNLITHGDVTT